jgi:hypothetical protein
MVELAEKDRGLRLHRATDEEAVGGLDEGRKPRGGLG